MKIRSLLPESLTSEDFLFAILLKPKGFAGTRRELNMINAFFLQGVSSDELVMK
jgi:hypothetical protein